MEPPTDKDTVYRYNRLTWPEMNDAIARQVAHQQPRIDERLYQPACRGVRKRVEWRMSPPHAVVVIANRRERVEHARQCGLDFGGLGQIHALGTMRERAFEPADGRVGGVSQHTVRSAALVELLQREFQ